MNLSSAQKKLLYFLFFLSGFCALVYEVLWPKQLSLTFGSTMPAVSIVAATFMGGLALGSYLIGRYADQETNLLRLFAWLPEPLLVGILQRRLSHPLMEVALARGEQAGPAPMIWVLRPSFMASAWSWAPQL